MFYTATDKEILEIRNQIFINTGITELRKSGFVKSPFSTSWFGRNNLGDYTYELCRLSPNSTLETVTTHISRGDKWIKIYLNVFKLSPPIEDLDELIALDGMFFNLPPASTTAMRLRVDGAKSIPLASLFSKQHKLGYCLNKSGFKNRTIELRTLISHDLRNIDSFIKTWHKINKPFIVNWKEGAVINSGLLS